METSIGSKHFKVQAEGELIYGTDKRPDVKDRKSERIFMGSGPDDKVTGEEHAHKKALSPSLFLPPSLVVAPLLHVGRLTCL